MFKIYLLTLFFCLSGVSTVSADTLTVAAASDLAYCLPELAKAFQAENPGSDVKIVNGASGSLFSQIRKGAPFDIFMSADMQFPRDLSKSGDAVTWSLVRYARGHLVLWTGNPNLSLDKGLSVLKQSDIKHLAMANPDTAPYGRAARAALQQAGLWEEVQSRLVFGENIAQTLQYAETGNADIAFVSRSLVQSPRMAGKGYSQAVPETLYPPLDQGLVITNVGSRNALSARFAGFMQSAKAQEILIKYGFSIPN